MTSSCSCNRSLAKPPLKLARGWALISHSLTWMWQIITALKLGSISHIIPTAVYERGHVITSSTCHFSSWRQASAKCLTFSRAPFISIVILDPIMGDIFYHDVGEICWPQPIRSLKLGHVTGQGSMSPTWVGRVSDPGKRAFIKSFKTLILLYI